MSRLLFEKTRKGIWISHLDLMGVFQRAFRRAGLQLKHSQGYNPRPAISTALPMSVGISSVCEVLEFQLESDAPELSQIPELLNRYLVSGVRVLQAYDSSVKVGNIGYLDFLITLEYDNDEAALAAAEISRLFRTDSLMMEKRTKNGVTMQNIIPMIRRLSISAENNGRVCMNARLCAQEPSLNPMQLVKAVELMLPHCKPQGVTCCRLEIYDKQENIFR